MTKSFRCRSHFIVNNSCRVKLVALEILFFRYKRSISRAERKFFIISSKSGSASGGGKAIIFYMKSRVKGVVKLDVITREHVF